MSEKNVFNLDDLVYHASRDYPGGLESLAGRMKMSYTILKNKTNPKLDSHHTNIRDLEIIGDFCDVNIQIAECFARKENAVVIKLPEMPDLSDMALLDAFMDIMRELGALSLEFQRAYEDGKITPKEFNKIEIEVGAVQQQLLGFQSAIKRVVTE